MLPSLDLIFLGRYYALTAQEPIFSTAQLLLSEYKNVRCRMLCFPVLAGFGDLLPAYLQLRRGIALQSCHFFMGNSIGPLGF